MDIQKVTLKLFTDEPATVNLDPFLAIFARWRHDRADPAEWVDLADYAHVSKGPGVVLIGQQGNLAIDFSEPGAGILWSNKRHLQGDIEQRIFETFRRTVRLACRLISEPEYPEPFKARVGFWELSFNDRLNLPNNSDTDRMLRAPTEAVLNSLLGSGSYLLIRQSDPNRRYGFVIHCDTLDSLDTLVVKLENGSVTS